MLGVYVHIPYCIQRCRYCDFTTFEQHKLMPPSQYLDLLEAEIQLRHSFLPSTRIDTLYFGGGTPSLFSADLLKRVITQLKKVGITFSESIEITLEVNPATVNEEALEQYLGIGFNRFSVGAQSFSDQKLKACDREHTALETKQTLGLFKKYNLNFSLDILFALPNQSLSELEYDVEMALSCEPNHISPYILTVPTGHPMSFSRPSEQRQLKMFEIIQTKLEASGFKNYEISNYALPGFESKHNLCYWTNQSYWGLGLSAHSYFAEYSNGMRFWNPKAFDLYSSQVLGSSQKLPLEFPEHQIERLNLAESLSDYCHTHLRLSQGMDPASTRRRFGPALMTLLKPRIEALKEKGLLAISDDSWALTPKGRMLSNQAFLELTFSSNELSGLTD